MASKHGLRRFKGAGKRPAAMATGVEHRHPRGQLVKRKDGSIVEMRSGYRPRVLSRQEVEALKNGGSNGA